ncbi:acetolactate synthase large subunit [Nocardioides insulae]|uniref:acetolactate synthase large subunit n=1 Tax=Nocardioides insulae TaxID=394734 RepID=UPI00048F3703|nr:acetolactate synthase large subunit [Nocardioides insulae]
MNGAESLVRTLLASGVDTCFANPGTSEMHFVDALDRVGGMRPVLGLFEGVVTGAADGYARMLDRPASTLLHLGPGLANGLSNLHNAMRAQSPVVNVIGDHATYHRRHDAPLTSDVEGTARPFSHWVRTSLNADAVATDAAAAVAAARSTPGRVASLILPADAAWNPISAAGRPLSEGLPAPTLAPAPSEETVSAVAALLGAGASTALLLGGRSTRAQSLEWAGRIAAATGATLITQTHAARITRGAGRVPVQRLPYPVDQARAMLSRFDNLVLVGAKAPVAFFAYPDRPSELAAPGMNIQVLSDPTQDAEAALELLADRLGATDAEPPRAELSVPDVPTGGPLDAGSLGPVLASMLPEGAIVVDESITTGRSFWPSTITAAPHDWLLGTGGAIGYAMPNAVGAAIACPDRQVVCLESDGSGLYQPQALWTMARENLDIVTVIFSNRRYAILDGEMRNVGGAGGGAVADQLFGLDRPAVDWVSVARGFGVDGVAVDDVTGFTKALRHGFNTPGPSLVEVLL